MNTATAAAVGTSPEVLQHYLTAGIDLEWQGWNGKDEFLPCRAKLHALTQQHARVVGHAWALPFKDCLPVLRPFSQLTVPLPTGEVPAAIEFVRSFVTDQHGMDWSAAHIDKVYEGGNIMVSIPDRHPQRYDHYYVLHSDWSGLPLEAYAWLVKNHFAVGLKPEQYIPLTAPSTPTREADNTATTIL